MNDETRKEREERWGKQQALYPSLAISIIMEALGKLPLEWRRKHLRELLFFVEDCAVKLTSDGGFTVAEHEPLGNVIRIYLPFVWNRNHLEDILIHEIAHHLGLNEKEVRKLEGLDNSVSSKK